MKQELRLFLLSGILAAHATAAQESPSPHAAQGTWYGAYVDDSPCNRRPSVPSSSGGMSARSIICSFPPILYVLQVDVQGEEAVGTLTTGPAPPMTSYTAMQRVLQSKELETPDALELRGTVEGNSLSIATADDVIVMEAKVRRDRMDAQVVSKTADGEQAVRFERCVPDSKSRRTASECSIEALWRRLAEENSGPRLPPPTSSISRMPPSLGQQPFPAPFPSSPP